MCLVGFPYHFHDVSPVARGDYLLSSFFIFPPLKSFFGLGFRCSVYLLPRNCSTLTDPPLSINPSFCLISSGEFVDRVLAVCLTGLFPVLPASGFRTGIKNGAPKEPEVTHRTNGVSLIKRLLIRFLINDVHGWIANPSLRPERIQGKLHDNCLNVHLTFYLKVFFRCF